jgi:hypothetical protein
MGDAAVKYDSKNSNNLKLCYTMLYPTMRWEKSINLTVL